MLYPFEAAIACDSLADVVYGDSIVVLSDLRHEGTDWTVTATGGETGAHEFGRVSLDDLDTTRHLRDVIITRYVTGDSPESVMAIIRSAIREGGK